MIWSMRTWCGSGISGFAINAAISSCLVGPVFAGMGPWACAAEVFAPWATPPPVPVAGFAVPPCAVPASAGAVSLARLFAGERSPTGAISGMHGRVRKGGGVFRHVCHEGVVVCEHLRQDLRADGPRHVFHGVRLSGRILRRGVKGEVLGSVGVAIDR